MSRYKVKLEQLRLYPNNKDIIKEKNFPSIKMPDIVHNSHHKIKLIDIYVTENKIYGSVLLDNIDYKKKVTVRYTWDDWKSYDDYVANYIESSSCANDIYDFYIDIPRNSNKFIHTLSFALCYEVAGHMYWDNNNSQNYSAKVLIPKDIIDREYERSLHK